jgi:hypothetical protein
MSTPSVADRIFGSGPLGRRQALARLVACGLGRIEMHGPERLPDRRPVVLARPGVGYFALRTGAKVGRVPDGARPTRRAVLAATERVPAELAELGAETSLPHEERMAA